MPLARVVTAEPRLSYRAEPGVAECCRLGWIGLARRGEDGDWLVEVHGNRLKCRVCMEAGQRRYCTRTMIAAAGFAACDSFCECIYNDEGSVDWHEVCMRMRTVGLLVVMYPLSEGL